MTARSATLAAISVRWHAWPEGDPVSHVLDCLGGHEQPSSEPPLHVQLHRGGGEDAAIPEGARPLFFHGRTRVLADERGNILFHDGHTLLVLSADASRLQGEVSLQSLADDHTFSHATLLIALAVALRLRGRFHLHGGLVSLPDLGTILIAGDAAHGKSTTTLGLLRDGGLLAGDDTLYLDPSRSCVWSLPKPLNLSAATAAAFAARTGIVASPAAAESGKRAYPAEQLFPGAIRTRLPFPERLLFPCVTGRPTTELLPISPAESLGHLMTASALVAVDGLARGDEHLAALSALVCAPGYELLLGLDALNDPGIPARLLRNAAR